MAPRPGTRAHAHEIARRLADAYGPRPFARHNPPVDELVTTVLSQSTTDANQHRAFTSLRAALPTWEAVRRVPTAEVEAAIRVAGLGAQKAPRIQAILDAVADEPRGPDLEWLGTAPLEEAMAFLTSLGGVGPKTAACVLLFSFERPVMPVDTHVHRIALRTRMVPARTDPTRTQARLTRLLPAGEMYGSHMRLVAHGRALCRARGPCCERCPLLDLCPAGKGVMRGAAPRPI